MSDAVPADSGTGRVRTTIALIGAVLAALTIPLTSLGHFGASGKTVIVTLVAFLVTVLGLLIAFILGLVGVLRRKGRPWSAYPVRGSLVAFVVAIGVGIVVGRFLAVGIEYPPIHDISTDTDNPPQFVALLPEREATQSPNTTVYNPKNTPLQKQGFPDLTPTDIAVPQAAAFGKALEAAKAMNWRIAAAVPEDGRIEAVDTTYWSGYIDDVVIRVAAVDEGHSRIDVRSESRVGGGDAGKNGMRIRAYLAKLKG